ncbi:hypothetical protein MQ089_06695 [Edwardsiella anguillarum]|uniref:hypothetical protein n=1 Tax=Edwardsiella anguillarum TaxID=1821960 RepID=UPI0024B65E8B|nr:hypothetical protein [Edwardsiella anguillarum]WHQ19032.1 hypothetical protein MQ085_06700 [Edwardsiella anguillarum]WHQ22576.1 hypothetical protein MQ089_06695 [Edwardsiella anguillarum]WHQ26099.1 hypothetical protein MQ094_06700 [Edwardsiella anguillarum]WHQ29615.1 hypothetical protein MQ093_06675 [Edwardsiella anguillarum]
MAERRPGGYRCVAASGVGNMRRCIRGAVRLLISNRSILTAINNFSESKLNPNRLMQSKYYGCFLRLNWCLNMIFRQWYEICYIEWILSFPLNRMRSALAMAE